MNLPSWMDEEKVLEKVNEGDPNYLEILELVEQKNLLSTRLMTRDRQVSDVYDVAREITSIDSRLRALYG